MKTLVLTGTAARTAAMRYISQAPDGYVFQLREPTRTLEQNSRMWAQLTDIAEQVQWYGETLTAENWKDIFTSSLKKQKAVPGLDGGFVVLGARTSKMTKGELSDLMTLIEAFGAQRGVKFGDEVAA